jgi:hypothetical protein
MALDWTKRLAYAGDFLKPSEMRSCAEQPDRPLDLNRCREHVQHHQNPMGHHVIDDVPGLAAMIRIFFFLYIQKFRGTRSGPFWECVMAGLAPRPPQTQP